MDKNIPLRGYEGCAFVTGFHALSTEYERQAERHSARRSGNWNKKKFWSGACLQLTSLALFLTEFHFIMVLIRDGLCGFNYGLLLKKITNCTIMDGRSTSLVPPLLFHPPKRKYTLFRLESDRIDSDKGFRSGSCTDFSSFLSIRMSSSIGNRVV